MFKFLMVIALIVVAAQAYDFSDSDYNQYLFKEFEQFNEDDSVAVSRPRRDAVVAANEKKECGSRHGDLKKDFACCAGDKFNPEHLKLVKEKKRQCAMNIRANNSDVENFDPFDCEKMSRIKQLIICESECFARAMNLLDESGKLNREAILKRFAEHLVGDSVWKKAVYEDYVDKCLAQAEVMAQEADGQCTSAPIVFHHCIWGEFINGCPADLRIDSHKCNKLREHHGQGNDSFFNKHLLHSFLHHGHEHKGHSNEQKEA